MPNRPTLISILGHVQNAPENRGRDIMTFSGFLDDAELVDHVWRHFKQLAADQKARVLRLAEGAR